MGDTGLNLGGNKKTAFAIKEVTVECGRKINVAMIHHIQLIFEQHELEHADPLLCLFFYNNKYYSTIQSVVGLIPRCWTLRPEEPWVWRPTISYTLIFYCAESRGLNLPSPTPCRCSRDSCNVVIVNDKVSLWMLRGPKETPGMPISSRKASKRLLLPNISKRILQISKILRNALTGVR